MAPSRPIALLLVLLVSIGAARADRVRLIETEGGAAQIRVDLVGQARAQIDVAYFIYAEDEAGLVGFHVLREAARRGCTVRLLVDWQWNKVARPMMEYLIRQGVAIRLYHPFHFFKPLRLTRRMHDKLLLIDGEQLVLGGRNIENSYFGFGEHTYLDRDVYVRGEAAQAAGDYFEALWGSDHVVEPRRIDLEPRQLEELEARIARAVGLASMLSIVSLDTQRDWSADAVEVGQVRFLHDTAVGRRKEPGIAADLEEALGATRGRLSIESPYLVLTKGTRRLLGDLVARGVQVRVLTNSLQTTDNVFAQAGYVGHRKELVRMGVELWEYAGPQSMHSKSSLGDSRIVIVGTYNLDPRSERLNSEIAVIFEDGEVAAALGRSMDANLARSWRIGPDGRPEGQRERYPGATPVKKLKLRLVRLVEPFIRGQL